jgi:hypothetical protein
MQQLPKRHSVVLFLVFVLVVLLLLLALASRPLAALAQEPRASSASDPAGAIGRNPAAPARPPRGARAPETAPAAVVLSNGQRWERFTLRHIDVRTLAPLFGAIVLPPENQVEAASWLAGVPIGTMITYPVELLAFPLGPGFAEGPPQPVAGPGFNGPGRLLILADPVTNSLIVDP